MFKIIDNEIQKAQTWLQKLSDLRYWIECRAEAFKDLPEYSIYDFGIDFDNLPHSDVMKVVKAFPGKWEKKLSPLSGVPRIDYEITDEGFKIRCWKGEPPPSCKLVKKTVQVPEQIIPAHEQETVELVCHE